MLIKGDMKQSLQEQKINYQPFVSQGTYCQLHLEYNIVTAAGNGIRQALADRGSFVKLDDKDHLQFYLSDVLAIDVNPKDRASLNVAYEEYGNALNFMDLGKSELRSFIEVILRKNGLR